MPSPSSSLSNHYFFHRPYRAITQLQQVSEDRDLYGIALVARWARETATYNGTTSLSYSDSLSSWIGCEVLA
jgi:hypothetical protein